MPTAASVPTTSGPMVTTARRWAASGGGAYCGWRWPGGLHTIIESLTIAAMNAMLLTGSVGYLDIPCSQIAYLIERGRMENDPLILDSQYADVLRRMDVMRDDDGDLQECNVHHCQEINPVRTEALAQLTCGSPQTADQGRLLHTRLGYYDAVASRSGLLRMWRRWSRI